MDGVFNAILQGVIKKWSELNGNINELKQIPSNLPLDIFPCYRQTLDHITKHCFALPKVKKLHKSNIIDCIIVLISTIQPFRFIFENVKIIVTNLK